MRMTGIPTPEIPEASASSAETRSDVSSIEADEVAFEHSAERLDDILHAENTVADISVPKIQNANDAHSGIADVQPTKDDVAIEVEKILEDGIGSFYASLPDAAKPLFKQKGEEIALEIADMVRTLHVRVKRLVSLISDWLKTIPGVNKFFLEQEAKIKADRIVELVEARKRDEKTSV